MRNQNWNLSRWGGVALGLSGLPFALFPLVRPFYDDIASDPGGAARTISSPWWMWSHVLLIVALVVLPLGFLAVFAELASSHVRRVALAGMVLGIVGGGLFLPVGGVEAFALPAIAQLYLHGQTGSLDAIDVARSGLRATVFFPGLVLLGGGGVLNAIAVWQSSRFPRWAGVPLAIGLVLFLPLLPQTIRIMDGVPTGIGGLWLGWAVWHKASSASTAVSHVPAEAT